MNEKGQLKEIKLPHQDVKFTVGYLVYGTVDVEASCLL